MLQWLSNFLTVLLHCVIDEGVLLLHQLPRLACFWPIGNTAKVFVLPKYRKIGSITTVVLFRISGTSGLLYSWEICVHTGLYFSIRKLIIPVVIE